MSFESFDCLVGLLWMGFSALLLERDAACGYLGEIQKWNRDYGCE